MPGGAVGPLTRMLALQTVQDGRQFLKYVDPRLGVPLPERDYGGNCLIYDADNKTDPFHNVWVRTAQEGAQSPKLPVTHGGGRSPLEGHPGSSRFGCVHTRLNTHV